MSESNSFKFSVEHDLSQIPDLNRCANIFSIAAFYGCLFVAKLSWKIYIYFLKNIFFAKYTLSAEKMFLYGKKKFYIENFFYWKKLFLQRKI